jgi:hypothetical protein
MSVDDWPTLQRPRWSVGGPADPRLGVRTLDDSADWSRGWRFAGMSGSYGVGHPAPPEFHGGPGLRFWHLSLPLWYPMAVAALPPLAWAAWRKRRDLRRGDAGAGWLTSHHGQRGF